MVLNKKIHRLQSQVFTVIIYLTWILYIAIALGLSASAPQYLDDLQYYVKIYICLFLIYRFNPFRRVQFTELDSRIAFSAGLFLLATTAIGSFLKNYLTQIKNFFSSLS
jgi:hypothetical protein